MSLFAKAAPLQKPAVSGNDKSKESLAVPGLEGYAKLDALEKAVKAVRETIGTDIKDGTMIDLFYNKVMDCGEVPESIVGTEGIATASLECRKRGTNQPLNDAEAELLTKNGIPVVEQVITEELFGINPKYTADQKLLEKINKLLNGKVPDDLFVKQERVVKKVVTDDMLKSACAKKAELPREVFSTIITLAIKPKLAETDLGAVIDDVKGLLVDTEPRIDEKAIVSPKAKEAAKAAKPPKKAKAK
jgi:hypothetical protein